MLVIMVGFVAFLSCERENSPMEDNATTRGAAKNDSIESDSGKVRYGDVVIDTTWNGETHINF